MKYIVVSVQLKIPLSGPFTNHSGPLWTPADPLRPSADPVFGDFKSGMKYQKKWYDTTLD